MQITKYYYNQISEGYEELHKEEQLKKIKIIKENINVKKTDILLDVGCGPGFANFDCDIVGVDPSSELLKKCRFKEKYCCKAEQMPFENNRFDIIVSITAVHNFDDIEKALKEIKRVGKNDCKIVISVLKKSRKIKNIDRLLKKYFDVEKIVEEDKDIIYFLKNYTK